MVYVVYSLIIIAPWAFVLWCFCQKRSFGETMVLSVLSCAAGAMLWIVWYNAVYPGGTIALILSTANDISGRLMGVAEPVFARLGESGVNSHDAFNTLVGSTLPHMFLLHFPALLIMGACVYCYGCVRCVNRVRRWFKRSTESMMSFATHKASRGMVNLAFVTLMLSMFGGESRAAQVIGNVYFLLYAAIGVCGFSYIDARFRQAIPFTAVRVILYLLAAWVLAVTFVLPVVPYGAAFVGMFDAFRDFRGLDKEMSGDV